MYSACPDTCRFYQSDYMYIDKGLYYLQRCFRRSSNLGSPASGLYDIFKTTIFGSVTTQKGKKNGCGRLTRRMWKFKRKNKSNHNVQNIKYTCALLQ